MTRLLLSGLLSLFFVAGPAPRNASGATSPYVQKETYKQYITDYYPEQLTSPEKKKRKNFAQFGYGLSFFPFPLFPITGFIDPHNFGEHSYGQPGVKEKNGVLYTCRGGFIDFSHMRVALDWTVYVTFRAICEGREMDLPSHDGTLKLRLKNVENLSLDDLTSMSQKIAFERLTWHELCSWYYHAPNYTFNERQSAFTPEDTYSNFLGTVIGKKVALRILRKREGLPYSQIASEEIQKQIDELQPVAEKKLSKQAYDIVDAYEQAKLPAEKRNKDVWWDSKVVFTDERYVFKRYMHLGPKLAPWLVPESAAVSCGGAKAYILNVPQKTTAGTSFYNYYTLTLIPDSLLFYEKKTGRELSRPFGAFTSNNMGKIMAQVTQEMQKELLTGFSRRNESNPERRYDKLKKVWFR